MKEQTHQARIYKKRGIIVIVAFFVLILFSYAGVILVSIAAHEFSHVQDYKDFAVKGSICLFAIGNLSEAGFYLHQDVINNESQQIYERINTYTELKAYTIGIAIGIIYLILFGIVFYDWVWRGKQ